MEQLNIILVILVLGLYTIKLLGKSKKTDDDGENGEADEGNAAGQTGAETRHSSEEQSEPVFAYYTAHDGRTRVDVKKSAAASGRELGEYEIFSEQKRLDKIYARELEEIDARMERRGCDGKRESDPEEYIPVSELMTAARDSGGEKEKKSTRAESARGDIVRTTRNGDADYQLRQLDRWLEAGLIDKKEYRIRKQKLERNR